jgi:hypothetical protein
MPAGGVVARRRTAAPSEGALVLPAHLVEFTGKGAAEFSAFNREQRQWLLEHGLDRGAWRTFIKLLDDSRAAHGLPDRTALTRARLRVADPTSSEKGSTMTLRRQRPAGSDVIGAEVGER